MVRIITMEELIKGISNCDYQDLREIFFDESFSLLLNKYIKDTGYTIDKPLDELLRKLPIDGLFRYIWKNEYMNAYVFDKYDQRKELVATCKLAANIVLDEKLREEYIANHDAKVKFNHDKMKCNLMNILK